MGGWAWQKLHEPAGAGVGILIVRPSRSSVTSIGPFERLRGVEVAGRIREQANLDAAGVAQRDGDAFDSLVSLGVEAFRRRCRPRPSREGGLGHPESGSRRPSSSNRDA